MESRQSGTQPQTTLKNLDSLAPQKLFEHLDLSRPELSDVARQWEHGNFAAAALALREHFRRRFAEVPIGQRNDEAFLAHADEILLGRFLNPATKQWVQSPSPMRWHNTGERVNFHILMARFFWVRSLAPAYQQTRDSRYVQRFVELADDFFRQHPLTDSDTQYPDHAHPRRWTWMDLQVTRRAQALVLAMRAMVHDDAFTPDFTLKMLAWIFDHAQKHVQHPNTNAHNMAMSEQNALAEMAAEFPEFRDSHYWLDLAVTRMGQTLFAQTTSQGVQVEWAPSYHLNVANGCMSVLKYAKAAGMEIPSHIHDRLRAMFEYALLISTPDRDLPAVGDTKRSNPPNLLLCDGLESAGQMFDAPAMVAWATQQWDQVTLPTSAAYDTAGMFVARDRWGPKSNYFILHNPPGGANFHDEPDNGTIEFYSGGRWLLCDTGFFTYGEDRDLRAWHRQTRVHQTMTLDGRDSAVAGRCRLWNVDAHGVCLVIENDAYPDLMHRRSLWFVDRRFLVLWDEAIGTAAGQVQLHFQLPPAGDSPQPVVELQQHAAWTQFDDVNLYLWQPVDAPVSWQIEQGYHAHAYANRSPRMAITITHHSAAPAQFLTLLLPFAQKNIPSVQARVIQAQKAGDSGLILEITIGEETWRLERDLACGRGACIKW